MTYTKFFDAQWPRAPGRPSHRIMAGYPVHRPANPWHGHRLLRRANIQSSATTGHSVHNADSVRRIGPMNAGDRALRSHYSAWAVCLRPGAAAPRQRERVHHRPGLQVEVIKAAQHALAMHHRRRSITAADRRLARHRVRCPGRCPHRHRPRRTTSGITPMRPHRLVGELDPRAKLPGLHPGRLIPRALNRPDEPPPAQQGHPHTTGASPPAGRTRPAHGSTPPHGRAPRRPRRPAGTARTSHRSPQASHEVAHLFLFGWSTFDA